MSLALIIEDQPHTAEMLERMTREIYSSLQFLKFSSSGDLLVWLQSAEKDQLETVSLVLLDLGLPDGSGVDLIAPIKDKSPAAKIVVVSIYEDTASLFKCLKLGASGYLLKGEPVDFMKSMLTRIDAEGGLLSPAMARHLITHFQGVPAQAEGVALTEREKQTLILLSRGYTVPETALELRLSKDTIKGYVKTIYTKLQVSSRAEATREAVRRGWV